MATVDQFLEEINQETRLLLDGIERPYDVGRRLWALGMEGASNEAIKNVAWPLWLIWGSLTDWIDGPRGTEPGAEVAASAVMKRAASEWLALTSDQGSRDRYFNRWVYDECGYERGNDNNDIW